MNAPNLSGRHKGRALFVALFMAATFGMMIVLSLPLGRYLPLPFPSPGRLLPLPGLLDPVLPVPWIPPRAIPEAGPQPVAAAPAPALAGLAAAPGAEGSLAETPVPVRLITGGPKASGTLAPIRGARTCPPGHARFGKVKKPKKLEHPDRCRGRASAHRRAHTGDRLWAGGGPRVASGLGHGKHGEGHIGDDCKVRHGKGHSGRHGHGKR
jgi:hypothetical protein